MDRLDLTHALMVREIGNQLFLAPMEKEKVHKILDVGTGTGIWAMEIGDIFPNAEVIGNDLSAIQPECNLAPGCWVEFQDSSIEYYSDDGTLTEDHAMRKWNKTLISALESMGREPSPGPKLEGWVREAGFQGVQHSRYKIPLGPWPRDPFHKDLGYLNLQQFKDGLEGFTMRMFCGVLQYSKEEAQVWLAQVRNELRNIHSFHSQFDLHVVYGQKPADEAP
ncbi:umta methyltransferase family protein [Colletotrichum plurivorum]|uniref:Umta methyltransferase family protein n=1 Tax=Colletotrichum plurivorum TaxID=2175906 RepID=A0A8H6NCB5_9PEZI|nr:umta methyltransferase family protein [Colletotrichum plurivorum]